MKIALLSNINLDSLARKLNKKYSVYTPPGYDTWVPELIEKRSPLYEFQPDVTFLILDAEELIRRSTDLDEIRSDLDQIKSYVTTALSINETTPLFVSNLDLPRKKITSIKSHGQEKLIEHFWYEILITLNATYPNFYIFDLKSLIEDTGRQGFYSPKLWYLGSIKYSLEGESILSKQIDRYANAIKGKRKKCLVLDLDNTLWGGIVGEDGLDGITLSDVKEGARFKDFQQRLKEMKDLGLLLTIVSKNNEHDALEAINNHPHMVLKPTDFVTTKINWDHKSANIAKIANDLNLGIHSFVFIDDSPFERESVKVAHPSITVPSFPADTSDLESFIRNIYNDYFLILNYTEEDLKKTTMYQQNARRAQVMTTSSSIEDFLSSLDTKIYVSKAKQNDVARVAQLTQKTNQFNLTTRRYTESDIVSFIKSDNHEVYVITTEDKFGDNGKIATVILSLLNDKMVEMDTFLLSCRVMGRHIEDQILNYLEHEIRRAGFAKLKAYYIPTEKNKPAETFLESMSYTQVHNDTNFKTYILNLNSRPAPRKLFGEVIQL